MNKKMLMINLILAIFIVIAILFSVGFQNAKKENSNNITQAKKLSTSQPENATTANSVPESTLSTEEMRKLEIENRIKEYGKQENGVPVLMYHFFYDKSARKVNTDNNFIEISKFEQHLKYLKENDYFFPTFGELLQYINCELELPKKSVIITVDDGDVTFFTLASPLIEKYEVPVTSFAITSQCGLMYKSDYINFESHTHDMHKAGKNGKELLVNVSYEKAYQDIEQSVSILNSKEAFCYPFGNYNDTAKQVLRDIGYKVAFTTKYGRVKVGMEPLELPRVRILRDDSFASFIAKVS